MKVIKLQDGMEIFVLPLPFDTDNYCFTTRGFYKNSFIYSNNSDLDNNTLSIIFNNRDKLNTSIFSRYFIYALYNDEIIITQIGRKLYDIIQENLPIINNDFKFKRLNISIKQVNSDIGMLPSYKESKFTDNYYNIKFKNLQDYVSSLQDHEIKYPQNFLNERSVTNKINEEQMNKIFNECQLGDFKTFIRKNKIEKIKNKLQC